MTKMFLDHLNQNLEALKSAGLYKSERVITSRQSANISVLPGDKVLNFCANNYLGLADNAELIEAGKNALDKKGYGMASVRFICGTQDVHKELESKISEFLGMEDTILYSFRGILIFLIPALYAHPLLVFSDHEAVQLMQLQCVIRCDCIS